MTVDEIAAVIRGSKFRYADEDDLQEGIAQALRHAGATVTREVRLSNASRIDLLCGRIGVEVKVAGSSTATGRQCARYLDGDALDGLVLVTSRVRHLSVPDRIHGKPVAVVTITGQGL